MVGKGASPRRAQLRHPFLGRLPDPAIEERCRPPSRVGAGEKLRAGHVREAKRSAVESFMSRSSRQRARKASSTLLFFHGRYSGPGEELFTNLMSLRRCATFFGMCFSVNARRGVVFSFLGERSLD